MERKIPLSVAIITKNESENLPECLATVTFADQVVIVDSGSTDNTREIASERGCSVFIEPWKGFGLQKQSALDKCTNPWILVLDADERIPAGTAGVIKEIVVQKKGLAKGYSFCRRNYFKGRWIRRFGWWPDPVIRLFRNGYGRISSVTVHEAVEVNGPVKRLDAIIDHYTESNLSRLLMKIDQYSTLGAEEALRAGKRSSVYNASVRAFLVFMQNYILRGGFLEGSQGLTLSITDSVNKFFKYAKLDELKKNSASCQKSALNEKVSN
ncbi:MAG: glycosyltransferase family 2 protein [Syntrophales bacterium]|jgi:glycosyltransferase involved in cell wall biosynthesis|nr:glycosyltransferase family 2 protein [Syntrophales bacterium]MDY0044776.1 glycosyltransferase family 2 protein [Syntrophales bacterium]